MANEFKVKNGLIVDQGGAIITGSTSIQGTFNQGSASLASGLFSHVQGLSNTASGDYSHAEGVINKAIGDYSHAEGASAQATGVASHAEGNTTTATGAYSHAEGASTITTGVYSHAEGESAQAIGVSSHAEGAYTQAIGEYSHAEGTSTLTGAINAYQSYFPSPGIVQLDSAYGDRTTEFIAGNRLLLYDAPFTNTYGKTTFIVSQSYYTPTITYVELVDTSVTTTTAYVGSLDYGIANWTGNATIPGDYSHTEGSDTQAVGNWSHAEGITTQAVGLYSHAEGESTTAIGQSSHAEGQTSIAIGGASHAEGGETQAIGNYSHAEGYLTIATGDYSHAEGGGTLAIGVGSHAEGLDTVASGSYQHVQGQYNISSSAQSAFIIGNGTSGAARSNLIFASGSQFQITGSLIVSGSITGSLFGTASWAQSASNAIIAIDAISANSAKTIATISSSVNAVFYPTFVDSNNTPSANEALYTARAITFNPSQRTLTVDTLSAIVVNISGSLLYSTAIGSSSAAFNGEIVQFGAGTLTAGQLYFLSSSGTWSLANANSTGSSTGMLGIAVGSSPTANGLLVRGYAVSSSYTTATGSILYAATSSGLITATPPSSSNHVVRVIGYKTTLSNTIYFTPDPTWVTLA